MQPGNHGQVLALQPSHARSGETVVVSVVPPNVGSFEFDATTRLLLFPVTQPGALAALMSGTGPLFGYTALMVPGLHVAGATRLTFVVPQQIATFTQTGVVQFVLQAITSWSWAWSTAALQIGSGTPPPGVAVPGMPALPAVAPVLPLPALMPLATPVFLSPTGPVPLTAMHLPIFASAAPGGSPPAGAPAPAPPAGGSPAPAPPPGPAAAPPAVPAPPAAPGGGSPVPSAIGVGTTGNSVKFLQDGTEYFAEFHRELQRVKGSTTDAYVHLAFWVASHKTVIKDFGAATPVLLDAELSAVATAGHDVKVILWDPGATVATLGAWFGDQITGGVRAANAAFKTALDGTVGGKIQVRLETYGGTLSVTMSQHEKIAIFSADGEVRVIVAGLNLGDWYWDEPGHPGTMKYASSGYGGTIHDTAVAFVGPATVPVEEEWNRRWRKVESTIPPEGPTPPTPQPSGAKIAIAVTDYENSLTQIHQRLLGAVGSARSYVYFENYAVIDAALVNALAARLQAVPSLQVLIQITEPRPGGGLYDYLHYLTYLELALVSCTSVTINSAAGPTVITRASHATWVVSQANDQGSLGVMANNKWLADSSLVYGTGSAVSRVPFSDIVGVTGGVQLYTPVRATSGSAWTFVYPHSKLALIDDEIAVIGSANFNYRSMLYDGELSAFVEDAAEVARIRRSLFGEFSMGAPAAWTALANTHAANFAAGRATPGSLYALPVPLTSFPRSAPFASGLSGMVQDRTWY